MRKVLLVLGLFVFAGAGVWFFRSLKPVVEVSYLDRDFRYDDTIPLKDAWLAFMEMRFETLDHYLARMAQVEKTSARQTPLMAFLTVAGRAEHNDRCAMWTKERPNSPYAWLCLGDSYNAVAFQFLSNVPIADVKKNPSPQFMENELKSEDCIRRAGELDPKFAYPKARLIGLDMVLGRERDVMEKHYREAVRTGPFCMMAYQLKADYLKPEWYGTWEEYQAYILETVARFPPNSLIPLALTMNYNVEYSGLNDPGYIERPDVWKGLSEMFEAYLADNPTHEGVRSLYFRMACEYQMEDLAVKQARFLRGVWGPLWILGGWTKESAYNEILAQKLALGD